MSLEDEKPNPLPEDTLTSESDVIETLRVMKGPCPDWPRLLAFQRGGVKGAECEELERHISVCGLCESALWKMRVTDDFGHQDTPGGDEAWLQIYPRLRNRMEKFLADRHPTAIKDGFGGWTSVGALKAFLRRPVLAYVLVLCLIYPAIRGARDIWRSHPATRTAPIQAVDEPRIPGLSSVAGVTLEMPVRGIDPPRSTLLLKPADQFFIVSFFVPVRSNGAARYDAEIVDEHGRTRTAARNIASYDGLGNFSLLCSRDTFASGQYRLSVREVNLESGGIERHWQFGFSLTLATSP